MTADALAPTVAAHTLLFDMLHRNDIDYRLIDHPPGDSTEEASRYRRHPVNQAAKSIVAQVRMSKKETRYVLAVVPGDRRVDFRKLRRLLAASDVCFAPLPVAERLAGSVSGTFVPFAFHPELGLVVDAGLTEQEEIYFNAALADRSIAMPVSAYLNLSRPPVVAEITAPLS